MALISNNISGSTGNNSLIGITGSVVVANVGGGAFPQLPSDSTFFVSGAIGSNGGKSLFGGDLVVSGSLSVKGPAGVTFDGPIVAAGGISGSLTKLSDGTSYLRQGPNIILTSGSNGSVTVESSTATLVYKPGATTDGNVYATWSELMAAFNATEGYVLISIDDSLTTPSVGAGIHDFERRAAFQGSKMDISFPTRLAFPDGATIKDAKSFSDLDLYTQGTTTPALEVTFAGYLRFTNGFITTNGTYPVFRVDAGNYFVASFSYMVIENNTSPIFDLYTSTSSVYADFYGSTIINDNFAIGVAGADLTLGATPDLYVTTGAQGYRFPINAGYSGTYTKNVLYQAALVNYDDTVVAGTLSGSVQSAIDVLKLRWASTSTNALYTTSSVAIRGSEAAIDAPTDKGTDVFFYVSGSIGSKDGGVAGTSMFGGDVQVSGSLTVGSGSVKVTSNDIQFGSTAMMIEKSGTDMRVTATSVTFVSSSFFQSGSVSTGNGTVAVGAYSFAGGVATRASGYGSHTEGYLTTGSALWSHAEGSGSVASAVASHVEGDRTSTAVGAIGAHAEGISSFANATAAHAEGYSGATGIYSHGEGFNSVASQPYAHVEGFSCLASGQGAHAEGNSTTASGQASHAEGFYTVASNTTAHAEGYYSKATGYSAHAEGYQTTSSFQGSHSEGYYTNADGQYAHAEGFYTTAAGQGAHAEGYFTSASFNFSHAEGYYTRTTGIAGHVEGYNTTGSGDYSHAEGYFTHASGTYSHAAGLYTIASGSAQYVVGKYNKRGNTTSLFVVGDGTADDEANRNDVLRIGQANVQVSGSLSVSGSYSGNTTTLSGGGTIDAAGHSVLLTSTGAGNAVTLSNGSSPGQLKYVVANSGHTAGNTSVITPTNALGYTTVTFDANGDAATFFWTGTSWVIVGSYGAAIT